MLKIAIAKTAQQIDEVLKLRHQVLAHQCPDAEKDSQKLGERLIDRFDAFPSTTHLIAMDKNETVIGCLRLTFDSKAGMPSDIWSDLRETLPDNSKPLCCDLHCVKPMEKAEEEAAAASNQHTPSQSIHTTMGMLLVASYFAISENITHVIASVNVESIERLKRIGFRTMICEGIYEGMGNGKDEGTQSQSGPTLVPLILDIKRDLDDSFVQFSQKNELQDLIHSYGCALYQPGEVILRAGAAGNCAFVIGEGEVDVRHPGSDEVIDTMGAGEVFGELALLTDQVRSADIIAKTEVRAMILEKSIFVDYLTKEPKAALKVLESMGYRMKHLIDYCNAQTVSV